MDRIFSIFIFTLLLLCQGAYVHAHRPFNATVTQNTTNINIDATNLVDLKNGIGEALSTLTSATDATGLGINLRGLDLAAFFPLNSTALTVAFKQTGFTATFDGGTRQSSLVLFKQFLKEDGNKNGLLRAYARYSPIDPIAGNPNSLMAQMAQSDYLTGRLSPFSGCDCCWSAQPIVHQYQAGAQFTRGYSKRFDATSVLLPLRYSYSPNLNCAFILDAPITLNDTGGAYSLFTSLGLGVRYPITHNWSLTPLIRFGFGGSLDLATGGNFVSGGLTSNYNFKISDYVFSMTNYAGYFNTANLWMTGVNFNYHLHNYVFKNGLSLTSCEGYCLCGRNLNFNISFIDSAFAGDPLYIRHYDEVSVSLLTTNLNPCFDYDCLSLGFAFQFGEQSYNGYSLNMVYQF